MCVVCGPTIIYEVVQIAFHWCTIMLLGFYTIYIIMRCSVSFMFVNAAVDSCSTCIREMIFSLMSRVNASTNAIVRRSLNSDVLSYTKLAGYPASLGFPPSFPPHLLTSLRPSVPPSLLHSSPSIPSSPFIIPTPSYISYISSLPPPSFLPSSYLTPTLVLSSASPPPSLLPSSVLPTLSSHLPPFQLPYSNLPPPSRPPSLRPSLRPLLPHSLPLSLPLCPPSLTPSLSPPFYTLLPSLPSSSLLPPTSPPSSFLPASAFPAPLFRP